MSPAMATIILRTFSACSCSRLRNSIRSSLVSPHRRHRQGMLDEVLSRPPLLPLVGGFGEGIGALDDPEISLRVVGPDLLEEGVEATRCRGLAGSEARQQAATPLLLGPDLFAAVHARLLTGV